MGLQDAADGGHFSKRSVVSREGRVVPESPRRFQFLLQQTGIREWKRIGDIVPFVATKPNSVSKANGFVISIFAANANPFPDNAT